MPLWVSSMTGGTEKAKTINTNLARACAEFKLGMGLGSCRPLLESNARLADFQMRKHIEDRPLFTNFGIAQLEELVANGSLGRLTEIQKSLEACLLYTSPSPRD